MLQVIRRHLNPATLVAVIALVFAMTGGAYAAKRYLITSTGQISPSVLKKLKGANGTPGAKGTPGAQGPGGATGAAGPQGGAGSAGSTGEKGGAGEKGITGEKGEKGATGSPWTPNNVLPKGAQETGAWITPANSTTTEFATISFPIALSAALDENHVRYVTVEDVKKSERPAGC